jgi:hypothetical protein
VMKLRHATLSSLFIFASRVLTDRERHVRVSPSFMRWLKTIRIRDQTPRFTDDPFGPNVSLFRLNLAAMTTTALTEKTSVVSVNQAR